jgi:hypothetical protein
LEETIDFYVLRSNCSELAVSVNIDWIC